ncbi:MAG: UbiA family prenyltransferase, partial [Gammaproteobacteria bacterium]|nr:UbiA family prenyltransferase [Gammaproteobacteria bacterium]
AYDTMYAMADREDDRKLGVKSTALLFGTADRLAVGLMQGLVLAGLAATGWLAGLGWPYHAALGAGAGLFCYQQALIRNREAPRCLRAFLNNQYFGLVIFVGILASYLVRAA